MFLIAHAFDILPQRTLPASYIPLFYVDEASLKFATMRTVVLTRDHRLVHFTVCTYRMSSVKSTHRCKPSPGHQFPWSWPRFTPEPVKFAFVVCSTQLHLTNSNQTQTRLFSAFRSTLTTTKHRYHSLLIRDCCIKFRRRISSVVQLGRLFYAAETHHCAAIT